MNRSNNSENFGSDDSLDTPPRQQDRRTVSSMFLSRLKLLESITKVILSRSLEN